MQRQGWSTVDDMKSGGLDIYYYELWRRWWVLDLRSIDIDAANDDYNTRVLLSDAAVDWTIGLRPRDTSTLTLSSSSLSCVVVVCEGTVT